MNFNVDFHYFVYIDDADSDYTLTSHFTTCQVAQLPYRLWNRHPDLTLLAIL